MISEEANPTGQHTRVTDMNMSLTFLQEIVDNLSSSASAKTEATAEDCGWGAPAKVVT